MYLEDRFTSRTYRMDLSAKRQLEIKIKTMSGRGEEIVLHTHNDG
jgi:hypothetical protein